MEDWVTQNALLAILASVILQGLKKATWIPFLSTEKWSEKRNLIVSILLALITQLGIHYEFHHDVLHGTFELAFTGSWHGIQSGLWEWTKQWLTQHGAYKTTVVLPELLGGIYKSLLRLEAAAKGDTP